MLISKGLTTYEYLKKSFEDIENPWDEGCCSNCKIFCMVDLGKKNIYKCVEKLDDTEFNRTRSRSEVESELIKYSRTSRSLSN